MGAILKYGMFGLLGLGIACGVFGGCNAGKIIKDNVNPLTNPNNPPVDRFGR